MLFVLACLSLLIVLSESATTPRPCNPDINNGYVEIGCWGYKRCVAGLVQTVYCAGAQVLERDSMTCVDPDKGNTDCRKPEVCVGKADGMYGDKGDNCQTYFRCLHEVHLGHFYCPSNLVFNDNIQVCDFPGPAVPC